MLAFVRGWRDFRCDAERMAASLALANPANLTMIQSGGAAFARVPGFGGLPVGSGRRGPAAVRIASGDHVLFTGWFDNQAEIAAQLGVANSDPASVYGYAVDRWGDLADLHVCGAYCAVIDRPRLGEVRLVRSPLSAPPLHYHRSADFVAAASVPRALFALGLPAELDEERLAMHLHVAVYDRPGGWYKSIEALQLGTVVTATRDGERRVRPYDPAGLPEIRLARDEDYVEAAESLLGEAVSRTLSGFRQPGTFLTGGLDSTIVASHMLGAMPAGQRLPTFTWTSEPGGKGQDSAFHFADERPRVEAFAAMHPRIEPHFTDNADKGFEDGMADLFLLSGISPASIGLFYPYQGGFSAARDRGCDLLIGAGFGNATFSAEGRRGYVEFLKQGRFRQLWRALAARPGDDRATWRRLVSLSLLRALPLPAWRMVSRWRGAEPIDHHRTAGALNPLWPGRAALEQAAHQADPSLNRPFFRSRAEEVSAMAQQIDADGFDLMQGLEQKYRIAFRDVTRYRPFVEFCWGLPTDQLMRDGESRYLARRMGRGRIPEAIRTDPRYGLQHGDWHQRIGRRREALLAELRQLRENAQASRLIDIPRLIDLLENFPETSSDDPAIAYQYQIALPNGIAIARLIRYVSGANA